MLSDDDIDKTFEQVPPWDHLELEDDLRMRAMASTAERAWTVIPWDRWTAFQYRGWPKAWKAKIEAAVGDTIGQLPGWSGLVHFAIIVQDDSEQRTCNINVWAHRLDDVGRRLPDDFLPEAESKRFAELDRLVYTNATDVLSSLERAESSGCASATIRRCCRRRNGCAPFCSCSTGPLYRTSPIITC
jgi:hypothetical protein